ncbi:hypothetical protein ACFL2I_08025, partial [Candidatus Omnitrophota bacterium]
ADGDITAVDIFYAISAAKTWIQIADDETGSGTYGEGSHSFQWTVLDVNSEDCYIKVADSAHDTLVDGESNQFSIRPVITITSPALDENLEVDSLSNTISWSLNGSAKVANVKLYYSYDGGPFDNEIDVSGTVDATQDYTWNNVPDTISDNAVIRVIDNDNANVIGDSSSFDIIGKIIVSAPSSGVNWRAGDSETIDWGTSEGTIGLVRLFYWYNSQYNLIDTGGDINSDTTTTFAWTVPANLITDSNIKVLDVDTLGDEDEVTGISANFNIIGGITVSNPGSTTVWEKDQTDRLIEWTATGAVTNVKIEYKTSAGGSYSGNTIVADDSGHTAGSNSYTWPSAVPDVNSEDCYVRVSDVNYYDDVYDESDQFSIRPVITVTTPALDANLAVGSNDNPVAWSLNGSTQVTTVDIHYQIDGGGYGTNVVKTGVSAVAEASDWDNVPDLIDTNVQIRVMDVGNNNVLGESASFDIIGSITMTDGVHTPDSNSNWQTGATDKYVTWAHTGDLGNVNIRYKYDGGAYSAPINPAPITVGTHSYNWPAIPSTISENVFVKVESENNPTEEFDESPQFKIKGGFSIDDPAAPLKSGTSHDITWDNLGLGTEIPTAKLEFYDGSDWHNYDYKGADTGSVDNSAETYNWSVPTDVRSTVCRFRISDPDNSDAIDTSSTFSVLPNLVVDAPLSSAKWEIGTSTGNDINWTHTGPDFTVKIEYSVDNGTDGYAYTVDTTPGVLASAETFEWNIPTNVDILSIDEAKIKVSDAGFPTLFDTSESFMVKGAITVTRPDTNDALPVLDTFNIEWTTTCTGTADMGDVQIEFRPKDTESYTTVVAAVAFDSSPYTLWSPPTDSIRGSSKEADIKITDVDNTEVTDTSDKFNIKGKMQIDAPNVGGGTWFVGDTTRQISWTPQGVYSNTEIHYAKDTPDNDPSNFTSPVLISTEANSGHNVPVTYDWPQIPNAAMGDDIRIRVRDAADASVQSISQDALTIGGKIAIDEPQSGRVWKKDEDKDITWTADGDITAVDIFYAISAAKSWIQIADDETGSGTYGEGSHSFQWTVLDVNSEDCYIKVADSAHDTLVDGESAQFSIRPVITVTAPAADENLEVDSLGNTVSWSLNGSNQVATVKLYYSYDGGAFDNVIDETGLV